jgi:hypothetical protein
MSTVPVGEHDRGREKQVAVCGQNIDDLELDLTLAAREAEVEVLATTDRADVDPRNACHGACSTLTRAPIAANRRSRTPVDIGFFALVVAARHLAPPSAAHAGAVDAVASRRSVYVTPGTTRRCCPSHSPTLRPWIAGAARAPRRNDVLRGGVLEPEPRTFGEKSQS